MRLYSSYSRRKEDLALPPRRIGMYFCGPTVYQPIHIGNARPFIFSMWLRRWLELSGYQARLVLNVTDINDRIYDAARAQGIGSAELARQASGTSRTRAPSVLAGRTSSPWPQRLSLRSSRSLGS